MLIPLAVVESPTTWPLLLIAWASWSIRKARAEIDQAVADCQQADRCKCFERQLPAIEIAIAYMPAIQAFGL